MSVLYRSSHSAFIVEIQRERVIVEAREKREREIKREREKRERVVLIIELMLPEITWECKDEYKTGERPESKQQFPRFTLMLLLFTFKQMGMGSLTLAFKIWRKGKNKSS